MRNETKVILLLILLGGLTGYAMYIAVNSFLVLVDNPAPVIKLEPKHETMEQTIARVAKQEGLNPTLTLMIADMESGLDPYFIRQNKKSIDRGVFAFNSRAYKSVSNECAFDPECATKKFAEEVKKGRLKNWLALRGFRLEILEKYLIEEK